MYNPNDPRFRRTLNQISQNIESANESAQVGLFSFKEHYLKPCLESFRPCIATIADCVEPCFEPCMPLKKQQDDRERRWRSGGRSGRYSRMESSFDFYDDWNADEFGDAEEADALLAAGNADHDRTSRVYGTTTTEDEADSKTKRGRLLGYGARAETRPVFGQKRSKKRRSIGPGIVSTARRSSLDTTQDPTIIPNQSFLGFDFLNRLPFKITGGGGLRYKPSAAGLQDHPGSRSRKNKQNKTVLSDESMDAVDDGSGEGQTRRRTNRWRGLGRKRSSTADSARTSDESLSSRGDIFPSDEEIEDAVPLTDEFDIVLDKSHSNSSKEEPNLGSNWRKESGDALAETKYSSPSNTSRRPEGSRSQSSKSLEHADADVGSPRSPGSDLEMPLLSRNRDTQIRSPIGGSPSGRNFNHTSSMSEHFATQRKGKVDNKIASDRESERGLTNQEASKSSEAIISSPSSSSDQRQTTIPRPTHEAH